MVTNMNRLLALSCALLALALPLPAWPDALFPPPLYPDASNASPLAPIKLNMPLSKLRRAAAAAKTNNPRLNPVMTSPPVVTAAAKWTASTGYLLNEYAINGSKRYQVSVAGTSAASGGPTCSSGTCVDNTITWTFIDDLGTAAFSGAGVNSYLWNGGAGANKEVFNYYGGVRTNDGGTSYARMMSATIASTLTGELARVEFIADSAKFVIRLFEINTSGQTRIIVNGQYASLTALSPPHSGWDYIVVDFTGAGGRAARDIIWEGAGGVELFGGVDVGATEGLYKPGGDTIISAAITGDSYSASGGIAIPANGLHNVMADWLGIRNVEGTAIGATGLLVANASGTAITRLSDITNFAPDIVFMMLGSNDTAFTQLQITNAAIAYVQALRAAAATAKAPIFMFGTWPHNSTGAPRTAYQNAETALQAAATSLADPLLFFIPIINDPNGAWQTGTGDDGAPAGNGNSDLYITASDHLHPNTAGHAFLGQRAADAVLRAITAAGY